MKKTIKMYLVTIIYILLFILNFGIDFTTSQVSDMWLILSAYALALSVILLIRFKLPSGKYFITAFILAGLVYFSYVSIGFFASFSQIRGTVSTFLAVLASMSVFQRISKDELVFIKQKNTKGVLTSVGIGIIVSIILGIINTFLLSSNQTVNPKFSIACFLVALSPAIYEEIALRTLFCAFCRSILANTSATKGQTFACYTAMILPHALAHTPDYFINGGLINGLISTVLLCCIFGLPFALLQKKRDILSAMTAHGMVDVIRFILFGIFI